MQITHPLKPYKVFLVGESCRDTYILGACNRLSPEAPVPILSTENRVDSVGMVGNVARNLEALNIFYDIETNDEVKLKKRRYVDSISGQQLLRVDEETLIDSKQFPFTKVVNGIYDAVVISDYNKGLIADSYIEKICSTFEGPIFVDTKRKDLSCFSQCFIKVNSKEYSELDKSTVNNSINIIITDGANGAIVESNKYPAPQVPIHDVTGAGDVFLATLTAMYLKYQALPISVQIAVNMASRSVMHRGSYTITMDDIDEICY